MTKLEKVAFDILQPINPSLILVLGIYTIVWGLWILCPFWTVFTVSPLYGTIASISALSISSEVFWGSIAILCGSIVSHGALKPSYANVQRGSFVGFFFWLVIATLYFMGDWHSTGGITAATFAIYSALVWVNTKVNRKSFKK